MNITSPINGNQVSDTTIQNNIRYFESINYKSTSDTLSAFISLVDKLKAANTAANFDVLVSTERRYYLAKFNELNNANDKLNSASVLTRIDKINNSSLLNYLLNLILIVSMTEIIRVLISVYNNLVPFYILIIGIIFVIIATIIFVIERTRRVRTDPDKIYWKESNEK
jgi:intein/homing endonuclease